MNLALSTIAATAPKTGAPGADAKGPLADFLALFENLGLSLEDGDPAGHGKASSGTSDAAVALLTKLSAQTGKATSSDTAPDDDPQSPEDALAALLASLDKDEDGKDTPAGMPDIARLLSMVTAIAARHAATPTTPGPTGAVTLPATAKLVAFPGPAGTAPAAGDATPKAQDNQVQIAFARLAQFLGSNSGTNADDANTAALPGVSAETNKTGVDGKSQMASLLARLTALTKTGAKAGTASHATARLTQVTQPVAGGAPTQSATIPVNSETPLATAVAPTTGDAAPPVSGPMTGALPVDPSLQSLTLAAAPLAGTQAPTPAGAPDAAQPLAEAVMRHHLDLARDSEWLDTLARDISRAAQHESQIRFQLNPEHLGSLKVELLNGAQGTTVKLTADTEAARAILADAQPRLLAEARAQGLRISEAQVHLGGGGASGHGNSQRHQADAPVVVRTSAGQSVAEIQQEAHSASSERYA